MPHTQLDAAIFFAGLPEALQQPPFQLIADNFAARCSAGVDEFQNASIAVYDTAQTQAVLRAPIAANEMLKCSYLASPHTPVEKFPLTMPASLAKDARVCGWPCKRWGARQRLPASAHAFGATLRYFNTPEGTPNMAMLTKGVTVDQENTAKCRGILEQALVNMPHVLSRADVIACSTNEAGRRFVAVNMHVPSSFNDYSSLAEAFASLASLTMAAGYGHTWIMADTNIRRPADLDTLSSCFSRMPPAERLLFDSVPVKTKTRTIFQAQNKMDAQDQWADNIFTNCKG